MTHTYKSCEALWFVFPLHTYEVDRYSSCNYQAAHACKTTVGVLQSENYLSTEMTMTLMTMMNHDDVLYYQG